MLASARTGLGEPVEAYFDTGAVIITLILVGKMLEARARTAAAILPGAPGAWRETGSDLQADGTERSIEIEDVRPGMRAVVLPGEKIPADGVVKDGALVGGPLPADG